MVTIEADTMDHCTRSLQFDVERRLARVKACRGRMRTGFRQALPEQAHRMMEKERTHE
jgi:hypothetical protein